MLSQRTRYALTALLALAELPTGASHFAATIAAERRIAAKFLETILAALRRRGIVRGRRGRHGGFQLACPARSISFGGVVRLKQGPLALLPCVSRTRYRRCAD